MGAYRLNTPSTVTLLVLILALLTLRKDWDIPVKVSKYGVQYRKYSINPRKANETPSRHWPVPLFPTTVNYQKRPSGVQSIYGMIIYLYLLLTRS